MLGELFDEGIGEETNGAAGGKDKRKSESRPPARDQSSTSLAGITNQGATCYLNSLIQTLLYTPELRDAVFSLNPRELGDFGGHDCRPIPLELQMLFANMLLLDQSSVSTTKLTDSFGWNNQEELFQHDVQELNRILFEALEQSLNGLSDSDIVNRLYRGTLVNQIRCKECDYTSERLEPYLDLTVAISGYSDLSESLTDCYLNHETLSGNNQYRCDGCNKLVDAEKGAKIRELPPILTFCLLRINFDFHKLERVKETGNFKFPQEISMGAYMSAESRECIDYELFSVVIHRGGAHGGHYHAIIKDVDHLGNWSTPAEKPMTSEVVKSKKAEDDVVLDFESPVDLLNHILSKEDDWMTMDKLSQRVQQETGVSWNKRFKNRHGTIARFINTYSDLYAFDEASRKIILLSKLSSETHNKLESPDSESAEHSEASTSTQETLTMNGESVGSQWFNFDDRRVKAVRESDIERFYGGKESAYMLFYRRKSLTRPPEAQGNKEHLIPEHILQRINEANHKIREEREAEERKLNTVTIKIYPQSEYVFEDNQIHAKSGHKILTIEVDQRKSVKELNAEVLLNLDDDDIPTEDQESSLYVVKPCYHLLHPMTEITDDEYWNNDTKIAACGIDLNSGVLLVSKSQITKHNVLTGSLHWPYQITFQNEEDSRTVYLAKSTPLQDLPMYVMKLFQLEPPIYLSFTDDRSGKLVDIPLSQSDPLYRFVPDQTIIKVSNKPINSADSSMINVFIQGVVLNVELKKQSITLELAENISQVITRIQQEVLPDYNLPAVAQVRLRCHRDGNPGPPMNPDRTVSESQLINGDTLLVEEGAPVPAGHIALYYTMTDCPIRSVVCRCNTTIDEVIGAMIDNSKLDKDLEYHIMLHDWMGDPSEVLYNTHHTLAKARIKNGDTVTLMAGKPPPKDQISLNIYWRTEEVSLTYMEWLVSAMGEMSLEETSEKREPQKSDYLVANITTSLDATVQELKLQIGDTIPDHGAVSVNHIRLRMMTQQGNIPGQIFKTPKKTLRTYKLKPGANLCMEVTKEPEQLSEDQILLGLRCRDFKGDYDAEVPLLWDTSEGATARKLKSCIASHIGCDIGNLCIAKLHHNQQEWRMIKITKPTHNKKGGKKKAPAEANLCKAPHFIQDGDLIGYIVLDPTDSGAIPHTAVTAETFMTDTDRNLKEASISKKRQQRKQRADEGGDLLAEHHMSTRSKNKDKPRVEKSISIKVGTFGAKKSPTIDVKSA